MFGIKPFALAQREVHYCSNVCRGAGLASKPLASRFWEHVARSENCWLWTGVTNQKGYGRVTKPGDRGKHLLAHRVSWELHNGPIPDGLLVLHHCDVPGCVRPDHLFLGTVADNSADMSRKKRGAWGERAATAKLTNEQVIAIRRRYAKGTVTQVQLGAEYGVSSSHICTIIQRKRWKHLNDPA